MSACIDIEETCGVTINKEDLPMFFTIGGIKQWLINNGYAPQPKVEDETVTVEETLTEEVSIEAEATEETIVPDTVKLTPSVEEEPIEATTVITESLVSYEKVPVKERTVTVLVPVGMTEEAWSGLTDEDRYARLDTNPMYKWENDTWVQIEK